MCVFAAMWAWIFVRIRPEEVGEPRPLGEAVAEAGAETGILAR